MKHTSIGLVNQMVLNLGWLHGEGKARKVWESKINEAINHTCVACESTPIEVDDDMRQQVVRSLSAVRLKAAFAAEHYAKDYLQAGSISLMADQIPNYSQMQQHVQCIMDASNLATFFMHKTDETTISGCLIGDVEKLFGHPILEEYHLDFWYTHKLTPIRLFHSSYETTPINMLALLGVALLCALHRVSEGQCSNHGNVIHFSTEAYASHFEGYQDGILKAINHSYYGTTLREQLLWLHKRGITLQ
ncbi:hypothetical protein JVU11DRAFT_8361 [Chiua virens]|nr:hypothetical protein JVU11DRAFT_8361 [Chiua virens]